MPCNGYNHAPDCTCGWGGTWHGNLPSGGGGWGGGAPINNIHSPRYRPAAIALPVSLRPAAGDFRSLTIPNARCPVCGASVFFYENAYGSRVFFDELGPPWPKHPCTDNSWKLGRYRTSRILTPRVIDPRPRVGWFVEKWEAVHLVKIRRGNSKSRIYGTVFTTGERFEALIDKPVCDVAFGVGFVRDDELSIMGIDFTERRYKVRLIEKAPPRGFMYHVMREKEILVAIRAREEIRFLHAELTKPRPRR